MAKDIKTHSVRKGTIKTLKGTVKHLDRSVREGKDIKYAFDRTKDAQDTVSPDKAPAEVFQYAEEQGLRKAVKLSGKAISTTVRSPYNAYRSVIKSKQAMINAKESIKAVKPTIKTSKTVIKNSLKSIQNSAKTSKNMIKTANTAVKTSASAAKGTAQAAKASYQAAKATAKVAVEEAKVIAKASIEVIKVVAQAVISAVQEIGALIAAGGWIAVVVIVLIALVIILAASVLGIFFSNENNGNMNMMSAVQSINSEYEAKIEEIQTNNPTDNVEMSGSRAVWSDVLAVYAAKVNYDADNPQDVVTLDENKISILTSIFWDMNTISSKTEIKTVTVVNETDDGNGNIIQTETQEEQSFLYITVTHKTAEEIAAQYSFSGEQKSALDALLAPENAEMWSALIYGTFGNSNIADVARSQIGNIGGEPYWRWYGFNSRVEWCACFVSWCANECGYIDAGVIPKYASCAIGSQWFKDRGLWQDGSYTPKSGDIIFFDWADENGARDGVPDHTGIVDRVDENYIYTIEGNSSNTCRQNKYPIGSADIFGYGTPAY